MSKNRPPRPDPMAVDAGGIPDELRDRDHWVVWRYKWIDDRDEWTKIPVDVTTGRPASSTDPETWTAFEDALDYHRDTDTDSDGLGFVLKDGGLVVGLDLDDCRDPQTGDLVGWAQDIVDETDTWGDVSPSGTGAHLYGFGFVPDGGNRADVEGADGHLEMYDQGRYLTVTGRQLDGTADTVEAIRGTVRDLHEEYIVDDSEDDTTDDGGPRDPVDVDDEELIERAKNAENGDDFEQLWRGSTSGYPSQSEADLALCGHLAFWTGGDEDRMDELFRASGLMRDKWDEDRGAKTYGERTIEKALDGRTEFYEPNDRDNDETGGEVEPNDESEPVPERVSSALVDAILDAPDDWIDPDTQTWTVRDTDDHDAETIADALRDGELPGDAWAALADTILTGDAPDELEAPLKAWREDPSTWDVRIKQSFGVTDLSPAAIAAAAGVEPQDLGGLNNSELATLVTRRLKRHEEYHFLTRRPDGTLFAYDSETGTWSDNGEDIARSIALQALDTAYTKRLGGEVVERLKQTREHWVHKDALGAPPNTIAAENGLVDVQDRTIRPLEPEDHVLSRLPVEFDPDADAPRFEQYLKEVVPNAADRQILQEYAGYTLMHWALPFHKALFIVGPQSSGKSTFLTVVKRLLGDDTTCSLAPQEFTEERFAGYDLVGALANIRSDIPANLIENTGKFKEVVAGDPVKVERKYEDPITVEPTAKHLFAANTLPSTEIEDDAFFRRILLVSFPDTIPREDRDPGLVDKLVDELPGILNWALDGLDRLREEGRFTGDYGPDTVRETWESWGQSIARFKSRCLKTDDSGAREAKVKVYDAYTRFCRAEGIPAESRQKFTRELKKDGGIGDGAKVTYEGSRRRAFTGVEILEERVPDPDRDTSGESRDGRLGSYGDG